MKKILFSFFIFLMFCSTASALEDTIDRYNSSYSEMWSVGGYGSVSIISDSSAPNNHILRLSGEGTNLLVLWSKQTLDATGYISWTVKQKTGTGSFKVAIANQSTISTLYTSLSLPLANLTPNSKVEVVYTPTTAVLYINGVQVSTNSVTGYNANNKMILEIWTSTGTVGAISMDMDDIGEYSVIGIQKLLYESYDNVTFTWSNELMRSYPNEHKNLITLYSLSNPTNAGIIGAWSIPDEDNSSSAEFGYITLPRTTLLGTNFGLYLLEMTRGDEVLTDQYFYYDQLSNPRGYPELLFMSGSSVTSEIRDEDQNGGEVAGGGSVYLYPNINSPADYTFTYNILETPYAISTKLSTVYNTSSINSTTMSYSGLSGQKYKVSIDGAEIGSTNGADTFSHTFTGAELTNSHIVSFAPDYTIAGVWGEVKNSETQEGIKSATVSISGENFSKTIYTDDNGLFYLTKGMEPGKTYTISVSKTGYSTPPSQTAITAEGSTTRQDFYMDKLSTSGSGIYYAPHDVAFTVREYWYSGAGLTGVSYAIYNGTESIKTGSTDSKGMFTGSDMTGGTNYSIVLTHNGKTYTEYIEPSLSEYTLVLNKEGILHQYANPWLSLSYTEKSQNVSVTYESNKTIAGATLTATAGNGTIVYTQTLNTTTGSFLFETGGEGDYTLNFHIQAIDGSTASQSWGLSYPDSIPLFPDSYPAWLKNILFSGIVMVFLLAFGKSKNDIACGAVAILTSMGYMFGWFTGSYYFVVLVWIIALGAVFLHYKRTGGIG